MLIQITPSPLALFAGGEGAKISYFLPPLPNPLLQRSWRRGDPLCCKILPINRTLVSFRWHDMFDEHTHQRTSPA